MSTLTLGIIVIIYMFLVAYLGYLGYKATKDASDYLLGGRKVNPVIMALSYGATFISASAIVGFGGIAAYVYGCYHRFYRIWEKDPENGGRTQCKNISPAVRPAL